MCTSCQAVSCLHVHPVQPQTRVNGISPRSRPSAGSGTWRDMVISALSSCSSVARFTDFSAISAIEKTAMLYVSCGPSVPAAPIPG